MRWASLGCVRSTVACAPVRGLVATLLPGYFPWRWDDVEFEIGWISEERADAVQKLGRALLDVMCRLNCPRDARASSLSESSSGWVCNRGRGER
jgi:hypothetical protein